MQNDQPAPSPRRPLGAKDVTAGVFLVAVALAGLYYNQDYEIGSAAQMGAGYMPMLVFGLLGLLGAAVAILGIKGEHDPLESWAWREMVLILGAMAAFGVLIERVGMAVSVAVVVVISGLADRQQTILGIAGLTVALVAICWAVFTLGLGLNVSFLPPALTQF
ncbi:tripartite tricarboxylate transporter TctB family protein (plasmid) [Rhizobium leguminosarum]|uniref:tripartite tricarboxylate transporter TctB family protein n=1 Tax=Rhizobium leguminosarum TaxID=384 RepID=UPI0010306872|nr:tripartite tricarboxylate transporter TctB family protein [Rhizobium leguminosarum]TBF87001.1 tripartite tricarboxylate transporter TctB family protein [Rhizobium leguminosarum]